MLSYVIPVEEKPPPVVAKNHLQLDLDLEARNGGEGVFPPRHRANGVAVPAPPSVNAVREFIEIEQICSSSTNNAGTRISAKGHAKTITTGAMSTESSASSLSSKASDAASSASLGGGTTPTGLDKLKSKSMQNGGTKTTSLKRVSFGSSKGSMVETLIYESPLQEEPEATTPTTESANTFSSEGGASGLDPNNPSTKVRVTFFESERPSIVHSPEPGDAIVGILNATDIMTSASPSVVQQNQYFRQASTDSGWDNPFRPDGDLSREADEIVELIREGKPIVSSPGNGALKAADERDGTVASSKVSGLLSASPQKGSNGAANCGEKPGLVDVQRTVVSPANAGEAEAVVIKKKPKCKCCVIQ